ncbi:hypothetical protein AB0G05_01550 [Nonomuraea wenchangensis]
MIVTTAFVDIHREWHAFLSGDFTADRKAMVHGPEKEMVCRCAVFLPGGNCRSQHDREFAAERYRSGRQHFHHLRSGFS